MLCDQPDGLLYKINLTRQQLQDETSINVKTLNRTISQLKEEGFISLEKGKICYYKENYKKADNMAAGGAAQIIFSATAPPAAFFQIHVLGPDGKTSIPVLHHTWYF